MKTLIIHPNDPTTHFLKLIYEKLDCTVIRGYSGIHNAIKKHDRIIMLGHGTKDGLLQIPYNGSFVVDSRMVQMLREKQECVFIWCDADLFVKKYGLKGFCTGMFISEVQEAIECCVPTTLRAIDESSYQFSKLMAECINRSSIEIFNYINEQYKPITNVIEFNKSRLKLYE